MSIVTIKNKYQVVIPQSIRAQIDVAIGDFFEATAEKGRIIFAPKSFVDRGIAQSLKEFKRGHSFGPFTTHQKFITSLHRESQKLKSQKN